MNLIFTAYGISNNPSSSINPLITTDDLDLGFNIDHNFEDIEFRTLSTIYQMTSEKTINQLNIVKEHEGRLRNQLYCGFSKIEFISGEIYEGLIKNGKLNGKGIITRNNKKIYEGNFKNNLYNGKGILYNDDESYSINYYKGIFKNGDATGIGEIKFYNGDTYYGNIIENTIDGYGEYVHIEGYTYKGFFKNGRRNGKGTIKFNDYNFYGAIMLEVSSDYWNNGYLNNEGKIIWSSGITYIGDIVSKFEISRNSSKSFFCLHGQGKLYNESKIIYDGSYNNNSKHGYGITYQNEKVTYEGDFYYDYRDGYGSSYCVDNQLVIYCGEWKYGLYHGEGTIFHSSGLTYHGNFELGEKNGKFGITDKCLKPDTIYFYKGNKISVKFSELNNSDEKLCSICYKDYKNNDLIIKLPNCNHFYHAECILKWLKTNNSCPMCRESNILQQLENPTKRRRI